MRTQKVDLSEYNCHHLRCSAKDGYVCGSQKRCDYERTRQKSEDISTWRNQPEACNGAMSPWHS